MNHQIENKLINITRLVYQLNDKYDVFMDLAGHINCLRIRFYTKPWKEHQKVEWTSEVFLDETEWRNNLEIIARLQDIILKLKSYLIKQ